MLRFLYLNQIPPGYGEGLNRCDLCFDTEIEDIINDRPMERCLAWSDKPLRPIYRLTGPTVADEGLCVCQKCVANGDYDSLYADEPAAV